MKKVTQLNAKPILCLTVLLMSIAPLTYAKKSNTISVATGDWNQDKRLDAAVLMKNKGVVELYIFLATQKGLQPLAYKKDIVWTGTMDGTEPYLKAKGRGSLLINSENDSVGRNRWQKTLTVSYRDKNFMVGGYTYNSYDTLDLNKTFTCDLNLFTGHGIKNKKAFNVAPQKIKLNNWNEERMVKQCVDD
ncbi:MAG: hypothetical protein KAG26_04305 [Methylococcales bacterium]|nr:hypothetical protein [Methylococcales bacterium]